MSLQRKNTTTTKQPYRRAYTKPKTASTVPNAPVKSNLIDLANQELNQTDKVNQEVLKELQDIEYKLALIEKFSKMKASLKSRASVLRKLLPTLVQSKEYLESTEAKSLPDVPDLAEYGLPEDEWQLRQGAAADFSFEVKQ